MSQSERPDLFEIGTLVRVHSDITNGPVTGRIAGPYDQETSEWVVRLDGSGVRAYVPEAFLSHADAVTRLGDVVSADRPGP